MSTDTKQKLIVVTNHLNDKGSQGYHKQIKKQVNQSFSDNINLKSLEIDSQDELNELFETHTDSKVLLLTPTSLEFPKHLQNRNAEQNQTAEFIIAQIVSNFNNYSTKILVLGGSGRVGRKIVDELKYTYEFGMVTGTNRKSIIEDDYSGMFDVVVNCVPSDIVSKYYLDCDMLFDTSGTFTPRDAEVKTVYMSKTKTAYIPSSVNAVWEMKDIGNRTTFIMLCDVVNRK